MLREGKTHIKLLIPRTGASNRLLMTDRLLIILVYPWCERISLRVGGHKASVRVSEAHPSQPDRCHPRHNWRLCLPPPDPSPHPLRTTRTSRSPPGSARRICVRRLRPSTTLPALLTTSLTKARPAPKYACPIWPLTGWPWSKRVKLPMAALCRGPKAGRKFLAL